MAISRFWPGQKWSARPAGRAGADHRPPSGRHAPDPDRLPCGVGRLEPDGASACHMNGRPVWNEGLASFVPRPGAIPGMSVAGAAAGTFSTRGCLEDGIRAGGAALAKAGSRGAGHRAAGGRRPGRGDAAALGRRGQGAQVARFPERCAREGRPAGRAGKFPLGRAHETLYHARHGHRSGQVVERGHSRFWPMPRAAASRRPGRRRFARPTCRCRSRRWARAPRAWASRPAG